MASDAIRKKQENPSLKIHRDKAIPSGIIHDFLKRERGKRRRVKKSVGIILDHLEQDEREHIRACAHRAGVFARKDERMAAVHALRCKHFLCPYCPPTDARVRMKFQGRRLISVAPRDAPDPRPQSPMLQSTGAGGRWRGRGDWPSEGPLRLRHLVLTIPGEAHDWLATHAAVAVPALMEAQTALLCEVHKAKPKGKRSSARVTAQEFGGETNVHIFGTQGFPRPALHLDTLLSGWRRQEGAMTPLRASWPEKYAITRKRWARLAKRSLALAGLPVEIQAQLAQYDEFSADIGPMVTGNQAWHKVKYSTRAMLDLGHCHVVTTGEKTLDPSRPEAGYDVIYTMPRERTKDPLIQHRVPLGPFISTMYRVKHLLDGTEAHRHFGFMKGAAYTTTCRLTGRNPVLARRPAHDPDRTYLLRRYIRQGNRYVSDESGRPTS